MEEKTIQELVPFNTACEEFISGKYILAEIKLKSILRLIAEDEKLRDIISSCIEKYDFNSSLNEYTKQTVDGEVRLVLPKSEKDIIAFVFNLLYRIDEKIINLYDFINKYYREETAGAGKEFASFAYAIIIPFKNAINDIYSKRHIIVETNDYQSNYYNKIMTTIKLITKNIESFKLKINEREEFTMLLNSLYLASEKNDKKLVFSLMIGLDYFSKCNKRTRPAYLSLEECFSAE